jgi:hypothetical protein
MALTFNHQTPAEFAARYWKTLHAAYQADDRQKYHYMIWWLWTKIQAGDLTSDAIRLSYNAYFGKSLNTTQWNTLVTTRFVPIKDRYLAWQAETLV